MIRKTENMKHRSHNTLLGADSQHHRRHRRPGGGGEVLGDRQGHVHPTHRKPGGDQEEIYRLACQEDDVSP